MAELLQCSERDRFSKERDRAWGRYTEALEQLRLKAPLAPPDEYRALETAVGDCRIDLDIAEMILQTHIRFHKCGSPPVSALEKIAGSPATLIDFSCFECGFAFRKTREWLESSEFTLCPNCGKKIRFHFAPAPPPSEPDPQV
jgi:hypothetical protein